MKKKHRLSVSGVVVGLLVVAGGGGTYGALLTTRVVAPADGASVPERPFVEGTASDPTATVWVVIRPMEGSDYWVQPPVTVRVTGAWKVQVYIGRPGNLDIGKHFEVKAVANPKQPLAEGYVLDAWPEAEAISQVIEVSRR